LIVDHYYSQKEWAALLYTDKGKVIQIQESKKQKVVALSMTTTPPVIYQGASQISSVTGAASNNAARNNAGNQFGCKGHLGGELHAVIAPLYSSR